VTFLPQVGDFFAQFLTDATILPTAFESLPALELLLFP
jgi:hypothetical protein